MYDKAVRHTLSLSIGPSKSPRAVLALSFLLEHQSRKYGSRANTTNINPGSEQDMVIFVTRGRSL
jgi:hypothetical protein